MPELVSNDLQVMLDTPMDGKAEANCDMQKNLLGVVKTYIYSGVCPSKTSPFNFNKILAPTHKTRFSKLYQSRSLRRKM